MLADWQANIYELDNPYIKINPYLIAPLTALVYFETENEDVCSVTIKGKEKEGDFSFTSAKTKKHILPVYGLYSGLETEVIITLESGLSKTLTLSTEQTPDLLKKPLSIQTSAEYFGKSVLFLSPTTPALTAVYDYAGDVRWYNSLNLCFDIKRAKNGRLLIGTHRLFLPPYHTTGVFEMGMIGKIYKEFRLPGGYHHDHIELENGNLLVLSQKPARGTVEDVCVLIDRNTGNIIKEWDYQTFLPQDIGGSNSQSPYDWFHNNSVWYDKNTNSLTLSGKNQDIVVNIDFDTSERSRLKVRISRHCPTCNLLSLSKIEGIIEDLLFMCYSYITQFVFQINNG